MAQNIPFPKTTVKQLPAQTTVLNTAQRVLFVGQKLPAGTATGGSLVTEIGNDNSWDTLFGAKSMLAGMLRAARAENGVTRFDAIPLDDDGGATDATAVVTFTGPATAAATITIFVGSKVDYSYPLSISSADTATVIGGALETAINADVNAPFTAANVAGVVTITAENGGEEANSFLIKFEGTVPGVTTTLTGWTGGTVNPLLTNIFDVIGNERYQTIVWPGKYATTELEGLLDPRFNSDDEILNGVGTLSINDSLVNVKAKANALNSESINILNNKAEDLANYKGGSIPEIEYVISSKVGAIRALRLTENANISQFVVSLAANDQIGGASIATLPYANTPITSIPTVEIAKGWTTTEIAEIRTAGGSVIGNNRNDSNIVIGEMVSTYKTDGAGNPDPTFKFLNFVDTGSNVAEYFFNNAVSDFTQSRLTGGGLRQGFSINNEKSIRATFIKYYQDLTGEVFLLLQDGEAALNFFKQNLVVTIDLLTGKVTVSCKVPIITQLREIIIPIQIAFGIEALAA